MASRHSSRNLDGDLTELLVQAYADRTLVLVTQLGKVGTLMQVTLPATAPLLPAPAPDPAHPNHQPLPSPPAALQLTTLLGRAPSEHMHTLYSLYASQIATIIWTLESEGPLQASRRSVVVGLALRKPDRTGDMGLTERERDTFREVMAMLYELFHDRQ